MSAGAKQLWRLATKLVADATLTLPAVSSQDVAAEFEDATSVTTGHAFYLLDAFARDGTKVFPLNDGLLAPGFFDYQVSIGYYRLYAAGPPPTWTTYLRLTNLSSAPVDVTYKLYRWLGLD